MSFADRSDLLKQRFSRLWIYGTALDKREPMSIDLSCPFSNSISVHDAIVFNGRGALCNRAIKEDTAVWRQYLSMQNPLPCLTLRLLASGGYKLVVCSCAVS